MKLELLQVSHFRNLHALNIEPSTTLNLIYGDNGSGKSSILEAIHFLGYGRSFRTAKPKLAIQESHVEFHIFARCYADSGVVKKVGLSRSTRDEFICSIDGERSKRVSDIVSLLPVQVFTPQSIDHLIGSPSARRKFIDWGLFHVEPSFDAIARTYHRVLRQRNALLKQVSYHRGEPSTQIGYWTEQLAMVGVKLDELRQRSVKAIKSQFDDLVAEFLPEFSFEISYHSGWDTELHLKEQLSAKLEQDIKFGHTSLGPHKGDFKVKTHGQSAFDILSRGQLRMLVAALQLAQTQYLQKSGDQKGVFLLDDIGAELDQAHRDIFVKRLLKTDTQIFITAIDKAQFTLSTEVNNKKMFHVKHGHVTEE
ncbi:DNA replication/repair protein RecF [Alteromonas oceanisediminis]|uniref:DNA replication/repair protein RecF n=1 Tax=Alteromonas oceanisediminis TaxID=2836180 RepID=UPI001BDB6C97|nr:DNA replication/repair protein RecF [Alteromonas oceanisediminis]MBT0586704.1 DNA replication/repair protein RecF [Alteromonas oceanisediminis]